MKNFIIILSIVFSGLASVSKAQIKPEPDTKEAIGFINTFFNTYKSEGSAKAVDYISGKNILAIISADQWNVIKSKLDTLGPVLGAFTGYELINQKNVASSLVLFSYLAKYKNHPLRFSFIFYKPEEHWFIYNLALDSDDLVDELKDSSKIK